MNTYGARIKLAEEMGFLMAQSYGKGPKFDPFTDANDDYAVLEWVRGKRGRSVWIHFKNALAESGSAFACNYKIGDFARATLKVLNESTEDGK